MGKRVIKILSLDGGGIRGIIPAVILTEIEKRIKTIKGNEANLIDSFELVAGTSTGGILGSALVSEKCNMSAKDILNLYIKRGDEIFSRNICQKLMFFSTLSETKFSHKGLDKVLFDNFGKETLDQLPKKLLIPAYDIHNRESYVFKSWKSECAGVPLTTVCRATSAAPTYFQPINTSIQGKERTFVDGGVYMNNPAVSAYVEMLRLIGENEDVYGDLENCEIYLLSLGTGQMTQSIAFNDAKNWGKIEWIAPLIDCIFDGAADSVDYQMKMLLGDNYVRMQINDLPFECQEMDNVNPDNLKQLKTIAEKFVKNNTKLIDQIVNKLC